MPRRLPVLSLILIVFCLIVLGGMTARAAAMPTIPDNQETIVLGQSRLSPGAAAAMRVLVRDHRNGQPVAEAPVRISLVAKKGGAYIKLFEGRTGPQGAAEASFQVPDVADPSQTLVVEAESALGSDRVARPVTILSSYRILLTSDKPIYQPGQTIQMRSLALGQADLAPARARSVEFVVEDAKGNKVFRKSVTTDDFGAASTEFALANEVNNGTFKLTAILGDSRGERSVEVKPYVLPKFRVEVTTDRPYYAPGEKVKGRLTASYFFGKSVDGGIASVSGFVYDVGRRETIHLTGKTDSSGAFEFEFELPRYMVAGGLDQQQAAFQLEATVTDGANHSEHASLGLPVASDKMAVEIVPEGGSLRPGLENVLYVVTSYPDGSPAACQITLEYADGQKVTLATGKYGLAETRYAPAATVRSANVTITAIDERGNRIQTRRTITTVSAREQVLIRIGQATARVGDSVRIDAFTTAPAGDVFLDFVRNKQTMSTRTLPVTNGRASVDLVLGPDLVGTLELHAYKVLSDGSIVRDTRLLVVSGSGDLDVEIKPDLGTYRPGQEARVSFLVTDSGGQPVRAALGVSAVDESVYALAEMDPGFARLYFLLEKELMQPKYEIHGFSIPAAIETHPADPVMEAAGNVSTRAALAKAPQSAPFSLSVNSFSTKQQDIVSQRRAALASAAEWAGWGLIALPMLACLAVVVLLRRMGALARGLAAAVPICLALAGVAIVITLRAAGLGGVPGNNAVLALAGLAGSALVAGAVMLIGGGPRDRRVGLVALAAVIPAYLILGGLLVFAVLQGGSLPAGARWLTGAYLALPLAFALVAGGLAAQRQRLATMGALLVALALVAPAPLVLAAGAAGGPSTGGRDTRQGPVMEGAAGAFGALQQAPTAAPAPRAATDAAKSEATAGAAGSGAAQQPPRLRQYFPETLLWRPNLITDAQGRADVTFAMADSITTWRLSALASSQGGELGTATTGLTVFQDFFVDLDLPVALTQDDQVSVPVAIYNYLPEAQTVRLSLSKEAWFALVSPSEAEKELQIQPNEVSVAYFRIRAIEFGEKKLTVTATGSRMSDAIVRQVTVNPNGKRMEAAVSGRVTGGVATTVDIPKSAVPGTVRIAVKVYPGFLSQVVEGLDSILRMPNGCFEQTSSTTYPNVLVLSYMKNIGKATPEVQLKAERYIGLGYQRLTTFEVPGGGFSLFGQAPADTMLSAYGVMEFADMARVWNVDKALIDRTVKWIVARQQPDGSWTSALGLTHNATWDKLKNNRLPVTSYIAWALSEAGYRDDAGRAIGYIKENLAQAEDAYVLALAANALAAYDPKDPQTKQAVDRLEGMKVVDGDVVYWKSGIETMMGGSGRAGSAENTAAAVYALLRADAYPETVNKGLGYLLRIKDPQGTWYTTQATVLALKAMLLSVSKGESSDGVVNITLNGKAAAPVLLMPETSDLVTTIFFEGDDVRDGANHIELALSGKGNVMYQIVSQYYLPWSQVPAAPENADLIEIDVKYDRTSLSVNDLVTSTVRISLSKPGTASWVLVDLGVPPGFEVLAEDLNALVDKSMASAPAQPTDGGAARAAPAPKATPIPSKPAAPGKPIKRYDLTGRQVIVYLESLAYGQPVNFSYRLRAKYPMKAQSPAAAAYDYYNPDRAMVAAPILFTVE